MVLKGMSLDHSGVSFWSHSDHSGVSFWSHSDHSGVSFFSFVPLNFLSFLRQRSLVNGCGTSDVWNVTDDTFVALDWFFAGDEGRLEDNWEMATLDI